jgi:putative serine protease PepD
MTTGFESYTPVAAPSVPRTDAGAWAERATHADTGADADAEAPHRIGHPRPARHATPYLFSGATETAYPVVADFGLPADDAVAAPATPGPAPRSARLGVIVLVVALIGVVGWQAYRLDRLEDRVADTDRQLSAAVATDRASVAVLETRAAALEAESARAFRPDVIAAAVLPSVFRVRAGNFTGTAFAVGGAASDRRSNLFTNFHVVESVWDAGDRTVTLERGDVEIPAEIVKVDEDGDLALLRVQRKIPGLATDPGTVKSGQQIMAVGAPLGLEDTVTSGVISAVRTDKIQFDASINPGNSGGPVINSAKQVVGIATAKARGSEGIGLAIPIENACEKLDAC